MFEEKKPLIIVVSSSPEILTWLYSVLYGEGYLVATCPPTIDAFKYVSIYKPELAIVGKDSSNCEALIMVGRIKEISPETRVLLLTEAEDWPTASDAKEAGADGILKNPYAWGDVLQNINRLLILDHAYVGRGVD